jgi:hypothetical protein
VDKVGEVTQFGYGGLMARRSVFVLAAVLLTVSCGGEQKGAAPPPPASASQPTAAPTPTPAATPFVSSADQAGAFAFTRAYMSELEKAFGTGDLSEMAPYRRSSCTGCRELEQRVSMVYQSGGSIRGTRIMVRQLLLGQSGPAFAKVTAVVENPASVTVNSQGASASNPPSTGSYFLLLTRQDNHWVVDELRGNVKPAS